MLLKRLWRDQRGFVATTDLILIATIVVLGMIVGLATLRNSVVQEFGDLATAVGSLNQSYRYPEYEVEDEVEWEGGTRTFKARVAGTRYSDESNFCEEFDPIGQPPAGISVTEKPTAEGDEL